MASSDDDEDLKMALALSMQQADTNNTVAAMLAFDLTADSDDEDEDEDMRRAIALSLQQQQSASTEVLAAQEAPEPSHKPATSSKAAGAEKAEAMQPDATPSADTQNFSGPKSILGLDRKAMEAERLARLGKRKRDPSPERPSKQIASASSGPAQSASARASATKSSVLQYPRGAIKRTYAAKYPRTDDITVDEVLQADTLNIAVMSSFMWDSEWLWKKLNPAKVKQIWVMNVKDVATQERYRQDLKDTGAPNLKVHYPPMGGMIQSMHGKFMLLFGKDKLRVVVPTANMTPIDWGEVKNDWQPGVMENSVFLIDLPRRVDDAVGDKAGLTDFGKELVYFLEAQELGRNVIDGVLKFDFSQTDHLAFVHSIGGTHKDTHNQPTGLPCLASAVSGLKLDSVKHIELDYAASSLGAINDNFLQRIYLAACGRPFTKQSKAPDDVRQHIRIYFPTDDQVKKSTGGPGCGGIISVTRQYYNAATFPRECLRNYDSTRRGMLSHNKLLLARGVDEDAKPFAWVYVGSANMSESAWGAQKVLKSGQMGSLNIRNWECGVVMRVPENLITAKTNMRGHVPDMSVFEGTIEVPFVMPGEEYGDRKPWFFKDDGRN